jgi:hypothetical protein
MTIEITKGSENPVSEFFSSPSRTPNTDDLARGNHVVPTEWAEQLERERDEARDQSQRLRVQLNHYTQANEMAEQAFRERDESHKIAERAIDDLAWFNETNSQRLRTELKKLKEASK